MKKITAFILVLVLALLAGCGSGKKAEAAIRVGSKDFTENLIVGEIYALALEDAGYKVERSLNISGSVVHTAITNNEIDLYPEYTGTGLLSILQLEMMSDPDEVYETVKNAYAEQFDIVWLDSTAVNDRQGVAVRTQAAEEYGIYTMSDLQKHADKLRFCSQGEFEYREDGLPGLTQVYGPFNFKSINVYDSGIKYHNLETDEADACPGYSTDARLVETDKFTYLEDDKLFWPPYYLAPIVRGDVLEKNPDIADVLNAVSAKLDTASMVALNAQVDIGQREYDEVAKEFYETVCK
jgi:osmoprotectant transport system substrate-binding protein